MKELLPSAQKLLPDNDLLRTVLQTATGPYKPDDYVRKLPIADVKREIYKERVMSDDAILKHTALYIQFKSRADALFWRANAPAPYRFIVFNNIAAGTLADWKNLVDSLPKDTVHIDTRLIQNIIIREELQYRWPEIFGEPVDISATPASITPGMTNDNIKIMNGKEYADNFTGPASLIGNQDMLFQTVYLSTNIITAWLLDTFLDSWHDASVLPQTQTCHGSQEFWHRNEAILTACPWVKNSGHAKLADQLIQKTPAADYSDILPALPMATQVGIIVTATHNTWREIVDIIDNEGRHRTDYLIRTLEQARPVLFPHYR